jgi:hypothetical protein
VEAIPEGWLVTDHLLPGDQTPPESRAHTSRLHWLLPDWPWDIQPSAHGLCLSLASPHGDVRLEIVIPPSLTPLASLSESICFARMGQTIFGELPAQPTWGWVSKQYGHKEAALSLSVTVVAVLPATWVTRWILPQ